MLLVTISPFLVENIHVSLLRRSIVTMPLITISPLLYSAIACARVFIFPSVSCYYQRFPVTFQLSCATIFPKIRS